MKKYLTIQSVVLFFLIGCISRTKREALVTYLTSDSCKYWYVYQKKPSKPYGIGYCINNNGNYQMYIINDSSERIIINSPMRPKPIWKLLNDSTIEFGEGINCKILYLNEDSIVLKNLIPQMNDTLKLHRDSNQLTRPIPNPIKDTIRNRNYYPL